MRRHIKYANVVSTLALLFAMSGAAVAGQHYLISQINQISPQVRKELRRGVHAPTGKPGPRGPQGPGGALSVFTDQGPKGERGPQGLPGNSGIVEVRSAGPQGVTGPEGPKGPVGNQGNPGAPGIPFAGAWDEHGHYGLGAVVLSGGRLWLSLKNTPTEPNIEHTPQTGSEWWKEL